MNTARFRKHVYRFFQRHRRILPWRKTTDPYAILVSEVMLQQTQVTRVIPKFIAFLKKFPTVSSLARASLSSVLSAWSGLGYNRRALYLKRAAEVIVKKYDGKIPADESALCSLPGVGTYTAAAVLVFAFNKPVPLIDTNVRTVFIYHFFPHARKVSDSDLLPLVEKTMDRKNPRRWFNALMDYGACLKNRAGNLSQRSTHYRSQTPFKGSRRQIRGRVLKKLLEGPKTFQELSRDICDNRLREVLDDLQREGMIRKKQQKYAIDF